MSYRCTGAFIFAEQVFSGGQRVDDDHPIMKTHSAYFVKVDEPTKAQETATAAPGVPRFVSPPPSPAPAKESPVQELPKKRGRPKKQVGSPASAPVESEGNENA